MLKLTIKIALELVLLCSLVFNAFVSGSNDTTLALCALAIFLVLISLVEKARAPKSRTADDVMFTIIGISLLVIGGFYLAGVKTGFQMNYNSIFRDYIEPMNWIKVFLIVLLTEVIRKRIVPRDEKTKKFNFLQYILMIAIFLMVDITICTKVYNLANFNQIYKFVALVVVQSISNNIFLNYLVKTNGLTTCLTYRFLMDLYVYLFPVVPKVNVFIEGVVLLVTPYITYVAIEHSTKRKDPNAERQLKKKENKFVSAIFTILFAILVMLVSREFKYAMIAVGSGSMTGTVNKGDAVIYKAYDKEDDELRTGDILVFKKDSTIIVHRIIKKYVVYGEEVYQTKGDANSKADNWIVKEEDVIGVVNARIPLIAWPSVKLNEWF